MYSSELVQLPACYLYTEENSKTRVKGPLWTLLPGNGWTAHNCIHRRGCRRCCMMSGAERAWAVLPAVCHQQSWGLLKSFNDSPQTSFQEEGKLALLQVRLVKRWLLCPKTLLQVVEGQYTLGSRCKAHFAVGGWPMVLHLSSRFPSWWGKLVHPQDCLCWSCSALWYCVSTVPALRRAGWVEQASSITPLKLVKRRGDVVWRKQISDWETGSSELLHLKSLGNEEGKEGWRAGNGIFHAWAQKD